MERKSKDKSKARSIFILEKVLEHIIIDAAATFPITGDAYDVMKWVELLKLMLIEAVRRKDVPMQPKYKNLSIEEKAKKVLELTAARVEEILKKQERKAEADINLSLRVPGPGPRPPAKPDEPEKEE